MYDDPIVSEIRTGREAYAARFNYNIRAIAHDMRQRQQAEGRKTVSFEKPRKPADGVAVPVTH